MFLLHEKKIVHASPQQQKTPEFVYYATPTSPQIIFERGFQRDLDASSDLSLNMYTNFQNLEGGIFLDESTLSQIGNPSIFIRTTSVREQALNNELAFINPNPNPFNPSSQNVHEIFPELYVYQIVPQYNFIDLSYSYENALDRASHARDGWEDLELLRTYYTGRNEYAAVAGIDRISIHSASRFQYFPELEHYAEVETILNPYFEQSILPEINPARTNRLGIMPSPIHIYGRQSIYYCNTRRTQAAQRYSIKKREAELPNPQCVLTKSNHKKIDFIQMPEIEMPNDIFKNNSTEIKVNAFNKKEYCLVQKNKYVYVDYCDQTNSKKKWLYTEFRQLIAEVHSKQKNHYYCLTAPNKDSSDKYARMEICDLNIQEQKWSFKQYQDSKHVMVSQSGNTLGVYGNYYGYLIEKSTENKKENDYDSLKILNFSTIQTKISKPFIQFSIDPLLQTKKQGDEKKHDYMNPKKSSAYFSKQWLGYQNYYNAHNNVLFSSYGYGPSSFGYEVCYVSSLVQEGGSSWNWVDNHYCSPQSNLDPHFRWYFKEGDHKEIYHIVDAGDNLLRTSDHFYNKFYAYTAGRNWTDFSSFMQNFKLGEPEKIFAFSYSNVLDKKRKATVAFHSLYDYFLKTHAP